MCCLVVKNMAILSIVVRATVLILLRRLKIRWMDDNFKQEATVKQQKDSYLLKLSFRHRIIQVQIQPNRPHCIYISLFLQNLKWKNLQRSAAWDVCKGNQLLGGPDYQKKCIHRQCPHHLLHRKPLQNNINEVKSPGTNQPLKL